MGTFKLVYTTVLLLVTTHAFSLEIKNPIPVNLEEERCIRDILGHPFTMSSYPGLLDASVKSARNFELLKDIDSFCHCSVSRKKEELELKKKDYLAWKFRDRVKSYEQDDLCAMAKFKDHSFELFFAIAASTQMRFELSTRLDKKIPLTTRRLASLNSVNKKVSCIESEIMRFCTRVKSLRNTYICIKYVVEQDEEYRQYEARCPGLIQKENDSEWEENFI